MTRYLLLLLGLCGLLAPALAVDIANLPDTLPEAYDLTWTVTMTGQPIAPLQVAVEHDGKAGYLLQIDRAKVVWSQVGVATPLAPVSAPVALAADTPYTFTLKRRADTVAVLVNHRRLLTAPAPAMAGTLAFRQVPAKLTVTDARLSEIGTLLMADDFMRSAAERTSAIGAVWAEDITWKVARYAGVDNPLANPPKDPKLGTPLANPWSLSYFPVAETSTNGFWWRYRGIGPSWCVVTDTVSLPSWDRYFFQAAVKTEADGEVGLVAGYQDNKNFMLFRWKQRDYLQTGAARAELVSVVDGVERVLASSPTGFDPGQWYTLRLQFGWRQAQVLVDGVPMLSGQNPGAVEGRVGFYASGSANPRRLAVDATTAAMYVSNDPKVGLGNDAALEMRTNSIIYFDDVKVGSWVAIDSLADSPYQVQKAGDWQTNGDTLTARTAGRYITGQPGVGTYVATADVQLKPGVNGGMFLQIDGDGSGYVWTVAADGQKLIPVVKGVWQAPVATSTVGVNPGEWTTLRADVDGPYMALYCNGTRVMDRFDATRKAGRSGIFASAAGVAFRNATLHPPLATGVARVDVHDFFVSDRWLAAWSTLDSEWYPADYQTKTRPEFDSLGPCIPLPTDQPGLFWHKGAHYHDLRLLVPATRDRLAGQTIHLSDNYQPNAGYRLVLERTDDGGRITVLRKDATVGTYPFIPSAKYRLSVERKGSSLAIYGEEIDPEVTETVIIQSRTLIGAYQDPEPIRAPMVGVTVTDGSMSAAAVIVETDGMQETFEQAPINWSSQSGIWAVMQRYTCQPKWNWFGGFGSGVPTIWNKYRLDGDQVIEAYMGVKMQAIDVAEEYTRRYRDLNLVICADGAHVNTGYAVIRGGKPNGELVTMMLRNGVKIWESKDPAHVLPMQQKGHRQWFAVRLEKRGAEVKLFIDNRLAFTFVDPDPIPGGYTGYWTLNNGIIVGRSNIFAEKATLGAPRAAAPLAVQEALPAKPVPTVQINGKDASIATFETGLDGWSERTTQVGGKDVPASMSGHLVRVRNAEGNTFLKVVNAFPAGDMSVVAARNVDFAATPVLHFDYCFDPGAKLNLYVRVGGTLYEFLLSGKEGTETGLYTVTRIKAEADGTWRHWSADLGALLRQAIEKNTGAPAADLIATEVLLADWSAPAEMRHYGMGNIKGGTAACFDNVAFLPAATDQITVSWSTPAGAAKPWGFRTAVDTAPMGAATAAAAENSLTMKPDKTLRFLHIQGTEADCGTLTVPIPGL